MARVAQLGRALESKPKLIQVASEVEMRLELEELALWELPSPS